MGIRFGETKKYGARHRYEDKWIALHAARVIIEHPTLRERKTFEAKPPDFWRALQQKGDET